MTEPTVSVIMPIYNVEEYVGQAVASVLAQSFTDFEVLIIDDGGHDRSVAICESFADPRIRIISQRNRGLAGARNTGILAARGRYVALLDGDDRWHQDKLLLHVIHLDVNPDVDVSYAGSRMIDASGRPLRTAMQPRLVGIDATHILLRNPVGNGSAAVLRRASLMKAAMPHPDEPSRACVFDESFRQSEDIELWVRLAEVHSLRFEGIAGLLTEYRIVGGGLSSNVIRQYQTWSRVISKVADYGSGALNRHVDAARAFQLRYLARRAVQLGDFPLALSLIRQAAAASPRILMEPRKTLTTLAAAVGGRLLPFGFFNRLTRAYTGTAAL